MSIWWKLAYILTPSISFAIGFVLSICTHTYWLEVALRSRDLVVIPVVVFVKSLGWGFGLAAISTIILTIILCIKKPWKSL